MLSHTCVKTASHFPRTPLSPVAYLQVNFTPRVSQSQVPVKTDIAFWSYFAGIDRTSGDAETRYWFSAQV